MNLIRVITERGESHILPTHTTVESSTTKRTIQILNQQIESLKVENEKNVNDFNTLADKHDQLIEIYNNATSENKELEQKNYERKKEIESLEKSISHIPILKKIIQLQSLYILYQQNSVIQPFFEFNDEQFQIGLRTILKKYISALATQRLT